MVSMAFRSLSNSRDRTSARIWSTSVFNLAISWADLFRIRTDVSQAVTGGPMMAMAARMMSMTPGFISVYCCIPMDRTHCWTSNDGHALAATSLCPMIRTSGNR